MLHADQRDQTVEQGDDDVLALAGAAAMDQGGEDAVDRIGRGDQIGNRQADAGRRTVGETGHRHQAAQRLDDDVHALDVGIGAGFAEGADRGVDDGRIVGAHLLIADAQPRRRALAHVLDDHVGLLGEFEKDLAALGGFQIERDVLLVAPPVEHRQRGLAGLAFAEIQPIRADEGRIFPRGIAAARHFDADHLRPQSTQDQRSEGTGNGGGQVQHPDAFQRARRGCGHGFSSEYSYRPPPHRAVCAEQLGTSICMQYTSRRIGRNRRFRPGLAFGE